MRHRLVVLHSRGDEMTAGEISERLSCSWPTTTRHLRVLDGANLVRVNKIGREGIYHIDRSHLHNVVGRWLDWISTTA